MIFLIDHLFYFNRANLNGVSIKLCNETSITMRFDCDDFAQHPLAQSILSDYLELVQRTRRESVDRHRRAARWSHGDCLPFRGSRFPIPISGGNAR